MGSVASVQASYLHQVEALPQDAATARASSGCDG